MMLYKRIVLPKGKKGGGNSTLDYNDKTIDFLKKRNLNIILNNITVNI